MHWNFVNFDLQKIFWPRYRDIDFSLLGESLLSGDNCYYSVFCSIKIGQMINNGN